MYKSVEQGPRQLTTTAFGSTTALLVGRPTSISDAHTDTKEPANLDDEEVDSGDFDPKGHSLMHPTEYTQVILRHRLAEIMGRISDHSKTVFHASLDYAQTAFYNSICHPAS
jgi:hypothetical protein